MPATHTAAVARLGAPSHQGTNVKVSEHFGLPSGQAALDFVDVDVATDTRLFLDPYALRGRPDEWSQGCVGLLQNFFSAVLASVQADDRPRGLKLLDGLSEPNETHLGYSRGPHSRGSGVGDRIAGEIWDALRASRAARSGLLQDLDEAALLVEGFRTDRVSDVTTNVLRRPLIDYTQQQAALHGIPTSQVRSGRLWDPGNQAWAPEQFVLLPNGPRGPLLLVPKAIVRQRLTLDPGEYYRYYVLPEFNDTELAAGRGLIKVLKDGTRKAYMTKDEGKARLNTRDGTTKRSNTRITEAKRSLMSNYAADIGAGHRGAHTIPLEGFTDDTDWQALLDRVRGVAPGNAGAATYHRAVRDLLTAVFYPSLDQVVLEAEIDQGRKRVDLRYTNMAASGFFAWLQQNFAPQPYIWCEAKNYTGDLGNDALDQICGRFSTTGRGNTGLLLCRSFKDKQRFIERCRDASINGRGRVVVLDDEDLSTLTGHRATGDHAAITRHLTGRFGELVA